VKNSAVIGAAASSAGAESPTALPAGRVLWITTVNRFPAGNAWISEKAETAVTTEQHALLAGFGCNVN